MLRGTELKSSKSDNFLWRKKSNSFLPRFPHKCHFPVNLVQFLGYSQVEKRKETKFHSSHLSRRSRRRRRRDMTPTLHYNTGKNGQQKSKRVRVTRPDKTVKSSSHRLHYMPSQVTWLILTKEILYSDLIRQPKQKRAYCTLFLYLSMLQKYMSTRKKYLHVQCSFMSIPFHFTLCIFSQVANDWEQNENFVNFF